MALITFTEFKTASGLGDSSQTEFTIAKAMIAEAARGTTFPIDDVVNEAIVRLGAYLVRYPSGHAAVMSRRVDDLQIKYDHRTTSALERSGAMALLNIFLQRRTIHGSTST